MPHFLSPLLKHDAPPAWLMVRGRDKGPIATTVEPAFESAKRNRGLLGRTSLAPDTALIIAPCGAVHTFGMAFPIDVIFAARDGRVMKIVHAVGPRRVAGALRAFATIEMAAGEAERHKIKVGDYLECHPARGNGSA